MWQQILSQDELFERGLGSCGRIRRSALPPSIPVAAHRTNGSATWALDILLETVLHARWPLFIADLQLQSIRPVTKHPRHDRGCARRVSGNKYTLIASTASSSADDFVFNLLGFQNPGVKVTTRQWTIIAVLFAAVLIVFCFGGMLLFANLTPSQTQVVVVKVTGTPLQFLIATPSPTPTLKPAATALPKAAPPPTATATSTSPSTPKPSSPPMSISLTRIADDMKALTVAQRDNYAKSLDGQIVRGKETVEDVLTKGNVSFVRLNVAGYPRSIVGLQDVPLDVTLPLQRGQSITFTAKIDGPALYVGDTFAMNLKLISLD